ncbi:MAG: hypothetical protein ABSF63_09015 [Candidatus Bathyarchaeia archaeon]
MEKQEVWNVTGFSVKALHESEIINYGFWLQKEGYSPSTVMGDLKLLRRVDQHFGTSALEHLNTKGRP